MDDLDVVLKDSPDDQEMQRMAEAEQQQLQQQVLPSSPCICHSVQQPDAMQTRCQDPHIECKPVLLQCLHFIALMSLLLPALTMMYTATQLCD